MLTTENALHGHTDEATAYLVGDYPYGFRLRTEIRYWLETTKHGDRLCSQTKNPKTGAWNKAKRSTYSLVGCMYLDEQEHVTWAGIGYHVSDEALAAFRAVMTDERMSDAQRAQLAAIIGAKRGMAGVSWSIHEGPFTDEDAKNQARIENVIHGRIARETEKARDELG